MIDDMPNRHVSSGRHVGVALASLLAALLGCTGDDNAIDQSRSANLGRDVCGVVCTLVVESSSDVTATVSIENPTDGKLVRVLEWDLPRDGEMTRSRFDITHDGEEVLYRGKLAKRAPPRLEDYLDVPPGYRVSARFDLDQNYELSRTGDLVIQYHTRLLFGGPGSGCDLSSNKVTLKRRQQ